MMASGGVAAHRIIIKESARVHTTEYLFVLTVTISDGNEWKRKRVSQFVKTKV
jgi:hypothetical protein